MRLKELTEKRNAIVEQMQAITAKATVEKRSASEDEVAEFEKLDVEKRSIEATIKMEERARDLTLNVVSTEKKEELKQKGKGGVVNGIVDDDEIKSQDDVDSPDESDYLDSSGSVSSEDYEEENLD